MVSWYLISNSRWKGAPFPNQPKSPESFSLDAKQARGNQIDLGTLIWEWKMSQDKEMVIQMVNSVSKRIFNYRRKIFGLKDTGQNKSYIAHMVNEMMKEGMPIFYPTPELIDRFFTGGEIE